MSDPEFRTEPQRLFPHVLDKIWSLNTFRPAGKILNERRKRKLAARFMAFEDDRFEIGAASVNCSSKASAARSEDHCIADGVFTHGVLLCAGAYGACAFISVRSKGERSILSEKIPMNCRTLLERVLFA